MRHARHNHGTGAAGAWPSLVASATAVSGVLLTTLGGGDAAADAGTGVAALGGVVVGGVLLVRARECAARQAEAEESRRAEQAEHARELAKRDTRIDELAEEVTAVTDDSGVLRRQMDELRVRFDDEMSFRVRLETEFDRLAEWARGELGRASVTLEATRDQLEQSLRRAAEAEAELAAVSRIAADEADVADDADVADVTAAAEAAASTDDMPAADDTFVMARQALDLLWSTHTLVAVSEESRPAPVMAISELIGPGELSFEVSEPLPDPYRVARADDVSQAPASSDTAIFEPAHQPAVVEPEPARAAGERLYRPFVLGVVTEQETPETPAVADVPADATTAIDLTAYDETTEFSLRGLRSARHSA